MLAFVLDSLRELLRVSRRVTNLLLGTMPEATHEHRRIYEALDRTRARAARQAMRAHLQTVSPRVGAG